MATKTTEKNELQQLRTLLEKMEKKGYHNFLKSIETKHFIVTIKKNKTNE